MGVPKFVGYKRLNVSSQSAVIGMEYIPNVRDVWDLSYQPDAYLKPHQKMQKLPKKYDKRVLKTSLCHKSIFYCHVNFFSANVPASV